MQVSVCNLEAMREIFLNFENRTVYSDRVYVDSEMQSLATSTTMSKLWQQIESLFT